MTDIIHMEASRSPNTTNIVINNLILNCRIGCNETEKHLPQPVICDVSCQITTDCLHSNNQQATLSDNSNNEITSVPCLYTVDYTSIAKCIQTLVNTNNAAQKHINLLERLAYDITEAILVQFAQISMVHVRLKKPHINNALGYEVSVEYTRQRSYYIALALGSNYHYPKAQLNNAIILLNEYVHNMLVGNFYLSTPVGFTNQADFCNTAIAGETILSPLALLSKIKTIEKLMGKIELRNNGPRIIDIDIILFANLQHQSQLLAIPHSRMAQRDFVLRPLLDIANANDNAHENTNVNRNLPSHNDLASMSNNHDKVKNNHLRNFLNTWRHPVSKKTLATLYSELTATSIIKLYQQ